MLVQKELKNWFIWEYVEPRTPWVNTVAYYPLTSSSTVNDQSWNNKNMTQSWTVTYGTNWWVDCAYFNGGYLYLNESLVLWSNPRTINCWFNRTSPLSDAWAFRWMGNPSSWAWITLYSHGGAYVGHYGYGNRSIDLLYDDGIIPVNNWTLISFTYDGTDAKVYQNWVYLWVPHYWTTYTTAISLSLTSWKTTICAMPNLSGTWFKGYMSNFIFENVARTVEEIQNYYNQTKSNYWL